MHELLLVGFGGGLGSILRYLINYYFRHLNHDFPSATFIINLTGCLLIGFLIGIMESRASFNNSFRLLLITGFCGGYTTFSTFSLENIELIQRNQWFLAISYSLSSICLGILCVFSGLAIARFIT